MKAFLLIAHGSRRSAANDHIINLVKNLEPNRMRVDLVDYAFLEFGDRPPLERVRSLVAKGVTELICFPFFLSTGKHTLTDIPEIKRNIETEFPSVTVLVTRFLGNVTGIEDLIINETIQTQEAS